MSTQQPEALRLADELTTPHMEVNREAAAELRRLHSVNAELLEALKVARHMIVEDGTPIGWSVSRIYKVITKATGAA